MTGLWFEKTKDDNKHDKNLKEKDLNIFDEVTRWLDIYFSGKNPDFIPKYKIQNLTPFRKLVIDSMIKIPYGETITYNDIAKTIARKKGIKKMSAQAVGGTVGWNPICIIIPCHRVVGANDNLTGYGGGIKNKIELLKIEKNNMDEFRMPKNELNPNVVDCIDFCTKNPEPMLKYLDELKNYNTFWYVTITPYSKNIEPNEFI